MSLDGVGFEVVMNFGAFGMVCWLVWHVVSKTMPEAAKEFREALKDHMDHLKQREKDHDEETRSVSNFWKLFNGFAPSKMGRSDHPSARKGARP